MIEIYTGVPGSGKTYRAVSFLYDIFLDDKSKSFGKFSKFYTNINEFKFSAFPDCVGFPIDFDVLLDQLSQLHKLAMSKANDKELNELSKSFNLDNAFFIIDEGHNFFDKQNAVLIWWLSYHRHLHQDIIIITQNLSLIDSKYKSFSEFFYKAIPSSLRIFGNKLKYEQYIGSRMFKSQRSEKFELKFNPLVYDLYTSGANTQSKKVIYKYLAFAGFGFLGVALVIYLIVHFMFSGGKKKDINSTANPISKSFSSSSGSSSFSSSLGVSKDQSLVTFICTSSDCEALSQTFTLEDMKRYIKKYKFDVLTLQRLPNDFYIYKYKVNDSKFFSEVLND